MRNSLVVPGTQEAGDVAGDLSLLGLSGRHVEHGLDVPLRLGEALGRRLGRAGRRRLTGRRADIPASKK